MNLPWLYWLRTIDLSWDSDRGFVESERGICVEVEMRLRGMEGEGFV